MGWFGKRKRTANSKRTTLSIEPLEDRSLMAAIPLASGQAVTFQDADGTQVKVKLVGPGSGEIELEGGVLSGADIDRITLNDTTGASKLKISTRGGTIKGTTINDLVINKALNEVGALKKFTGRKVDFLDGGEFTADGGIEHIHARSLGGEVSVDGNVHKFKTNSLDADATVDISGVLKEFVAKLMGSGSTLGANQIDMLKIKDQAQGASVEVGLGGLTQAKIKNIYNSSIATEGMIGGIVVKGDAMGAAFASNINMGSDQRYGTIDDFIVDRSGTGYIQSIKLKGAVGGDGVQKVRIVSSGQVGNVEVSAQGNQPMIWEQAASSYTPLSIVQAMNGSIPLTGFTNDEIYVALFCEELLTTTATTGLAYYLAPSGTPGVVPTLTQIPIPTVPGPGTPNLTTLSSSTLSQWADGTLGWGTQLNFPTPPPGEKFTGRIIISAGAPVQAQIALSSTVNAPSPGDPTDPSNGTFYDFIEFTVTADTQGNPSLDADTSQVDSFGMPMELQFFQPLTIDFSGTIDTTSNSITGITSTTGLYVGQVVAGPNIPNGAMISGVTPSTTTTAGSVTLNTTLSTPGSGSFTATSSSWEPYTFDLTGTAVNGQAEITNVAHLNTHVLQRYFAIGQPLFAPGILAPGTVVTDYDIPNNKITLNQNAIGSTPNNQSTSFSYQVAGPVGVDGERDDIMSPTNTNGLTYYLQQLVDGGNNFARPFLQSTAPFLANGPVMISGATNNGAPISIATSGGGNLQAGDVIEIDGVVGNTAANGVFQVASATSTAIVLGSPIGNGNYVSSTGTWSVAGAPVQGATASQAVISANSGDINTSGLTSGNTVTIENVGGNTAVNGTFIVGNVASDSFELAGPVSDGVGTGGTWTLAGTTTQGSITTTSAAGTQIILTADAAGLVAGDVVIVSGVTGNDAANGTWVVTNPVVNPPTFTGFTLGSPAGTGAFTSGGQWGLNNNPQYNVNGATRGGQVVVTTNSAAGLANGDSVVVSNVQGNTAANGSFNVSNVTSTTFTLEGTLSNGFYIPNTGTWTQSGASQINVTGASNGPIVINTANTSGLANGDLVTISGVQGNTAANGTFVVSNVVPNTSFQLANPVGNATYQKFGTWTLSVTDALNTAVIQSSTPTTGLNDGDFVNILGVTGNLAVNGEFVVDNVTASSFTLAAPVGNVPAAGQGGTWNVQGSGTTYNITAVTDINLPIVITTDASSNDMPEVGDIINLTNTVGNSAANGLFVVSAINGSQISLGAPVSTTAYTSSAGTWTSASTPSVNGTVSFASQAQNITIVTASTAGLVEGSMVEVMGVQGNSNANNIYYVTDITPTTFTLEGITSSGGYTLGGIWKQYAALNRLASPKDLTEALTNPADLSSLNNYYNDQIDDFFLNYLNGSVTDAEGNVWVGGGAQFSIVSSAYGQGALTYQGGVKQVMIKNSLGVPQYSGYALQLSDLSGKDPNTYNIIYPFFNTNTPSPEVYTPLFGSFDAPTWIVSNVKQFESASQMIFACDSVFADNTFRLGVDIPATMPGANASAALGDLENSIAAAFNRGIILNDADTWSENSQWYPPGTTYNYWVEYWHKSGQTVGDLAYAFPYDDKYGMSTNLEVAEIGLAQITLGSWGSTKQIAQIAITSPTTQPIAQQGPASFTATLTAASGQAVPGGNVAFFLNGAPLNDNNDSAIPPLQLVSLTPATATTSTATIAPNLPATSDAGNAHTYTLTAVYSGDGTYLPTVATFTVQIAAA